MNTRKRKWQGPTILVILCLSVNGCATFNASSLPQRSVLSYVNHQEKKDLVVAADNFYTREKCNIYFDTDLTKKYTIPIFFIVSNKGKDEYVIDISSFKLTADNINGELSPMASEEVAEKVKRGTFWRTFGWCIIAPIAAIPAVAVGSGMHTGAVNKNARSDVRDKNLENRIVPPNDTVKGVVFFSASEDRVRELINPQLKAVFSSSEHEKLMFDIDLY